MLDGSELLGQSLAREAIHLRLILLLPLVGAVATAVVDRLLERRAREEVARASSSSIGIGLMALSLVVAIHASLVLLSLEPGRRLVRDRLWSLLAAGPVSVDMGLALDPLAMMVVLVVTSSGLLIRLVSAARGHGDTTGSCRRSFAWLDLSSFSVLLLALADNLVVMSIGWAAVGLCSHGSILCRPAGHAGRAAGIKPFVVDRIGDCGFVIGLCLLFWSLGGEWPPGGDWRGPDYRSIPERGMLSPPDAPTVAIPAPPTTAEIGEPPGRPFVVTTGPTFDLAALRDRVAVRETGVAERLRAQRIWGLDLLPIALSLLFLGVMGRIARLALHIGRRGASAHATPLFVAAEDTATIVASVYFVARLGFLLLLSSRAAAFVASICGLTAFVAACLGLLSRPNQRSPRSSITAQATRWVARCSDLVLVRFWLVGARLLAWFDTNLLDGAVNALGGAARFFATVDDYADRLLVDGIVNGLGALTSGIGRSLRRLQTGRVRTYLFGAVAGGIALAGLHYLMH